MGEKVLILTCHHKNDEFISVSRDFFCPVHAGTAVSNEVMGISGDNTGENISEKNKYFSELTVLFWAWKNTNSPFVGLMHYRRILSQRRDLVCEFRNFAGHILQLIKNTVCFRGAPFMKSNFYKVPSAKHARQLSREFRGYIEKEIDNFDVFVPRKEVLYGLTVREHYIHCHNEQDLEIFERILFDKYPDLASSYHEVMNGNQMYTCNMFIARRSIFNDYCAKLFDILFEMEPIIVLSDRSDYQKRIFGFISERFLNVYLHSLSRRGARVREVSAVFIEDS